MSANASATWEGLARAIDSKDFANVDDYLRRHGPVTLPGLRFAPWFDGQVLIEYDPSNPEQKHIFDFVAAFWRKHTQRANAARMGANVKVPAMPRFKIVARSSSLLLQT